MNQKISNFIASFKGSKILSILVLFIIISAVPLTVFIAQKQQEIRQRASESSSLIFGKALKITQDQQGAIIEGSKLQGYQTMTAEVWVKLDQTSQSYSQNIIKKQHTKTNPYNSSFDIYINKAPGMAEKLEARFMTGGGTIVIPTDNVLDDKKWHHLAVVSDPVDTKTIRFYVDGQLKGQEVSSMPLYYGDGDLFLGISQATPTAGFTSILGEIDEVRISNTVRYNNNFEPSLIPFVEDSNTVGLWHLDNNINDSSSNNNVGSLIGNPEFVDSTIIIPTSNPTPTSSQSESNKAVYIDGNSYIKTSDSNQNLAMTRDFTVEAWVKPQVGAGPQLILGRLSPTYGRKYMFAVSTNSESKVALHFLNPNQGTRSEFVMPVDTWSHVAAVQKDNTIIGFINGEKVFEKTDASPNLSDENNSVTDIGAWINPSNNFISQYFKGGIDDLRVSNIARDVESNWQQGVYANPLVSDSNTLALWHFDNNLNDSGQYNIGNETVGNITYIEKPTITPTPTPPTASFGNAASFAANTFADGSYVKPLQTHTIGNFTNATWEAWINLKEKPGALGYPIISKRFLGGASGDSFSYLLEITPERKLKFYYSIMYQNKWAPVEAISNSPINPNTWTHVAVVYDNVSLSEGEGKLRIYINGIKDAEKIQTGAIGGGSETQYGDDVLIGTDPGVSYSFNGEIDEVRISKSPRYTGSTVAPSRPFSMNSDTLLLCHFDESSGTPVCSSNSQPTINTFSKNIQFIYSTISTSSSPTFMPTPILTLISTPTSSPSSTKIGVTILLDGVNLNPAYDPRGKEFRLQVFNSFSNQLIKTANQNMQYTKGVGFKGNIDLGDLATGVYTFKFKTRGYLRGAITNQQIISGIVNPISSVTLLAGDIYEDNKINNDDYKINTRGKASYLSCLSKITAICLNNADLNLDRKVNNKDYSIMFSNMGKTGQ